MRMSHPPPGPAYATWSPGISRLAGLSQFLGAPVRASRRWRMSRHTPHTLLGWGHKPLSLASKAFAKAHGWPFLALEDGFLRSVGFGPGTPSLSLVWDDQGIYYDARTPSRLEGLVLEPLDTAQRARAQALVAAWRAGRVSKYNHAREFEGALPLAYVLVVDQTAGDQSIACGLADASSFQRMLAAALHDHPECEVIVKVHPEVAAGRKRGHFDLTALRRQPRVRVLADDVHPVRLVQQARAVYVVTSQVGFEALLWGRPVHTFGMPFYAGWGLTHDALPAPVRRQPVTGLQLVHACLVAYPRYRDPESGECCEVEAVLAHLAFQRAERMRHPAEVYACGFSRWKRPLVASFLQGSRVHFVATTTGLPAGACIAVWGRKDPPGELPDRHRLLRLEDGFLRSVGLGADLTRPLSWVVDDTGIYFDRTCSSRLEHTLQASHVPGALLARASGLRHAIVAHGLTKYNVTGRSWRPGAAAQGRLVVLVAGQVEGDASVRWGGGAVTTNRDLLLATRRLRPDAHLVYKPHPDVLAGLRPDSLGSADAEALCDELVRDANLHAVLNAVDEVHVLTSLTGFEALLRGKRVVCHGQPFYAGWGLTEDTQPHPRRTRRLSLDELVAGALMTYPRYVSRRTGAFTTPESALQELLDWRQQPVARFPLGRWLRRGWAPWRQWLAQPRWPIGPFDHSARTEWGRPVSAASPTATPMPTVTGDGAHGFGTHPTSAPPLAHP